MVQYQPTAVDVSFPRSRTPRGVASLSSSGGPKLRSATSPNGFHMTLTGMKKHVGVLEHAGLVITEKVGRVRTCRLGRSRLEQETAWIERFRQTWDDRFDALETIVEDLNNKETSDGRRK